MASLLSLHNFYSILIRLLEPSGSEAGETWVTNTAAEFCLQSIFFMHVIFFYMPQIYDMRPTALLPLLRKSCYGFLSLLKIHLPRPDLNPRTLGPVANTLQLDHRGRLKKSCPSACHGGTWGQRSLLLILNLGTRWG
jgi:hypothetical protein